MGYGRIAVVPAVNVAYGAEDARKIKALKGFAGRLLEEGDGVAKIGWVGVPPAMVKCMPGDYADQMFVAWDEGLSRMGVGS